jgi:hypothetical protein
MASHPVLTAACLDTLAGLLAEGKIHRVDPKFAS